MSIPEALNSIPRSLLDACPDGVIVCNQAGYITEWNAAATQLLGWTADECLGRAPEEFLIAPADRAEYQKNFCALVSATTPCGQISSASTALITRAGGRISVKASYSRILIGDDICAVAYIRKCNPLLPSRLLPDGGLNRHTSREKDGSVSETSSEGEKVTGATNEFLANVTHELRTPMNAILGMTELALQTELTDVVRDYLLTARDSAYTMLSLINDILDYTRLDVGRDQLDVVSFDLRGLLQETLRGLSLKAYERGLELAASVDPDVPFQVYGDPARLRQILNNFVSNAIKFTEHGEIIVGIKLQASATEVNNSAEWKAGDSAPLHFFVKDTGIGIDPADHDHIFSPFVQVDSSVTRSYPGTGLGLSICSQLARLMGGRTWVESTLGKGSTFHFTACLNVAEASDNDQSSPSLLKPDQLAGTRVLIVDDNRSTRQILKEMVEEWKMHASIADSVASAWLQMHAAAAAGTEFQLLIIDALMPTQDGIDFLRELDSAQTASGASILMMSRGDQLLFRKRIADLNVHAFLEKPVSQSGLLKSITEAFENVAALRLREKSITRTTKQLRVLVAEDVSANQKVVSAILSRRGHEPTIAHNGREAINLFERGRFDVILMDVQMPILDGIQATRAIRELEKSTGRRTPIVAMTAHTMSRDRDACYAAGMDGYMSKPLDAQLLLDTIEALNQPASSSRDLLASIVTKSGTWRLRREKPALAGRKTHVSENTPPHELWNPAATLRRMGGDTELLSDMVDYFLEDASPRLQDLKELIAAGNSAVASRVAHSLKGLCSSFEGEAAAQIGALVEAACNAGELSAASKLIPQFDDQIRQLSDALLAWRKRNSQATA
jgi:two-component system sensor histidine kinase/response regulator